MESAVQEKQMEELLKQVEELHRSLVKIKENKSLADVGFLTETQILDIILNNYQKKLFKQTNKLSMCG